MIYATPKFTALRAVRERRVYKLPSSAFSTQAVDDALLFRWLAEVFYPDRVHPGLREQYRQAYRAIYRYELSDAEIDRALLLQDNSPSAGYERFARTEAAQS